MTRKPGAATGTTWSRRSLPLIVALGLVAVAIAGAATYRALTTDETATTEHPAAIPRDLRTVAVTRAMPAPSVSARHLSAMLEAGTMPAGKTMAEVLTDTECTPDAQMISRCRNVMRLQDGSTIVVRHPHDMRRVPCLAPDERVALVPNP